MDSPPKQKQKIIKTSFAQKEREEEFQKHQQLGRKRATTNVFIGFRD